MICGGATIAGKELGMAGKKYVDKRRTKRNMTDEEKQWYQTVYDKDSKAIEKKRAFLLFLISGLNNNKDFFNDAGKCFDAIKKAEDEEKKKNNNINPNESDVSQSKSQNVGKYNIDEKNIAEEESKNNVNNSKTNNKNNEAYHKENKEINNDSTFGKDKIDKEIKDENKNTAEI